MLEKEDQNWPSSGNYGLIDQNLAIKWVKDNIKMLGGDPDNITIFGQSTGSYSVCYHMIMPISKGLLKRAILESESCVYPIWANDKVKNEIIFSTIDCDLSYRKSETYISGLGCSHISCLRNLTQDTIKNYKNNKSIESCPNLDGIVIPDDQFVLFKNGNFNKAILFMEQI